jgi:hypothetical protein
MKRVLTLSAFWILLAAVLFVILLLIVEHRRPRTAPPNGMVINVVTDLGIDNSGNSDVSESILKAIKNLNPSTPATLFFPPGKYTIDAGVHIPATESTFGGLRILGAGMGSTYFLSNCTNGFAWWYDNQGSTDNLSGPEFSSATIQDTSYAGRCRDLLRFTQTAMNVISRMRLLNAQGNTYKAGNVSISGNTITGRGVNWTSEMIPSVLQVNNVMAEICGFKSTTQLVLCDTAWPGGAVSNASYAIAWGGRALTFDAGKTYTQYITVSDVYISNSLFGIFSMGTSKGGNSRITVQGKAGWIGISGKRIPNSVGIWLGKHSDTFQISIPVNNVARCFVMDSAHTNFFDGADCENNSNSTPVDTCNGGVAKQDCIAGYEISADANSTGFGNSIGSPYVYLAGTAVKVDNTYGAAYLSIMALRSANFSNLNSYEFSGVKGCPASGVATTATIVDWDCTHTH